MEVIFVIEQMRQVDGQILMDVIMMFMDNQLDGLEFKITHTLDMI